MGHRNLKFIAFALVLLLSPLAYSKTDLPQIIGKWQFHKMIYRGQVQDPMNPNLVMTLDFDPTGLAELFYYRTDEQGFCHRLALWYFNPTNGLLYQRVTWLNPQNRSDCSQDTDMRMNQETWSPVTVVDGELHLSVPLGDEDLTLVWKKISRRDL